MWMKKDKKGKNKKIYCSQLGAAAAEQKMSYQNNFAHLHLASGGANKIFLILLESVVASKEEFL